jgi:hypothetical protein
LGREFDRVPGSNRDNGPSSGQLRWGHIEPFRGKSKAYKHIIEKA